MKNFYIQSMRTVLFILCIIGIGGIANKVKAQNATVAIPVSIGRPCGTTKDSVKYFNYTAATNMLTHRSDCKPSLASPGFSSSLATITFNPYDQYLYFTQIKATLGIYSSYTYRWLPTTCPALSAPVYKTFTNQFVAGVEFDPQTGLGYQFNFVDSTGYPPLVLDAATTGQYTSAIIVNGNPAVAYYDVTNKKLKYTRANDPSGQTWSTPITISASTDYGQYASMAIVNGNPAIAFYDFTNGDLRYVRATDANGTAWSAPVAVATTNNVGQFASLVVVNGNPAIAYYDVTNLDLAYVRATDANGTAWGTPVSVATTGSVGQYTSMAIVNGNPAISYYDATNGDLKYVRSSDASGTAWPASVSVETTGNVGQHNSLAVVNGNPAISYYDVGNGDLRYARATDASGTAWGTPMLITGTNNIGQYSSMTIVNGNPAIAYFDVTNSDTKFIRATNANGTAWGTIYTCESAGTVGQYASVFIANGNPAVCYYDATNKGPKYVRANDTDGTIWYKATNIFKMELQQVNMTTGTLGVSQPIDFRDGTGAERYIYQQNGDVVMTPGGQMLASWDNKYMTVNWQAYGTATPLVATYIDTFQLGSGNNLVGLAYSDGKLVGSISASSACSSSYKQVDILTGALSNTTYNAGSPLFVSTDMTDITSGIGAAKKVVSVTNVSGNTYDVVYEVVIKNYGGTPVTNVQAYDTLTKINGAANLVSGSITSFTAPPGITQNALFNGNAITSLLTPGATLSNIPGQNTITIRITCRLNNIQSGIYYYNQAFVSGNGLFGDALRDASTNGSNPDLNANSKPDDAGEDQPTPFIIQVTPITAPCASLTNVLYTQDFGTGTGLSTAITAPVVGTGVTLPTATTGYTGAATQPIATETYTITNQANSANTARFVSLTDHTGNANGRMMVINADANNSKMYRASFTKTLCASQQYSIVYYAAFVGNPSYKTVCDAFGGFVYPKIKMRVVDGATGSVISEVSTGNITATSWQQYGFKFTPLVSFSDVVIELINDAPGGCGNDVAIDDIQFGSCDALPTINVGNVAAGCLGSSTTFNSTLTDPGAITGTIAYQWQVATSASGPWSNIAGANSSTYTIASLAPADTGKYYRLVVAAAGNMGTASCEYPSPGVLLSGKASSLAPTSANKNKNNICPGITVQLSLTGGSLGSGASWKWYTGSPGGTLIGSGSTLNVTPAVTTTYYVRAEGDCNTTGAQSVTVTINCNIDKDRDGIPDFVESNMSAAFTDANSNGVINAYDPTYAGFVDYNNDYVNDNFQADGDSDNDGIPNYLDATFPGRVDTNGDGVDDRFDQDKDGVINMLDLDSDNDGIPDVVEAYGVDTNGDAKIDNFVDADGDGLSDNVDTRVIAADGAYNTGVGLGLMNLDGDALPNFLDTDSDNDGIPDIREVLATDANNDGKVDGFTDVNGDGLHDSYINAGALLITGTDGNADGRADSWPNKNLDRDLRPNAYDLDSDGDGIVDAIEAGGGITDTNLDGLADGAIGTNGWSTTVSALGTLTLRNTDTNGNPDYLDIDSDDDGIPDNIEGMSTLSYQLPTTTDTDGDGLASPYDNLVGFGGSGIFVYDNDGDGIPDYRDLDTDGDGAPDICEGNDWNFNGICDEPLVLTGLDTDGDGLDNLFDSLNSVTNLKGTSYMMGNGGSLTGDATPGTKATVQKKTPAQGDRDWRWTATVLPVQFLGFTGAMQSNVINLNWTIIADKAVDHFEIERSTDNTSYTKVGTVTDAVQLYTQQSFGTADNITGVNGDIFYYKLKVVGKAGEIKYSNVLVVRRSQSKTLVAVMPNPANDYATVRFYVENESEVTIRLVDNIGKTVLQQKQKVARGNNAVQLNGLFKYSSGVYTIQVLVNNEIATQKLVLSH